MRVGNLFSTHAWDPTNTRGYEITNESFQFSMYDITKVVFLFIFIEIYWF